MSNHEKHAERLTNELKRLKSIHYWDPDEVVKYIACYTNDFNQKFVDLVFKSCGIPVIEGKYAVAKHFMRTGWLHSDSPGLYMMTAKKRDEYTAWLNPQSGRSCEPELVAVSETLEELSALIEQECERVFYDETVRCLRAEAFRGAIVMAWNLVFDHVKRWVFNEPHRLIQFNKTLTSRNLNRKSKTKCQPIVDFDDFESVKEFVTVEILQASKLITKTQSEKLKAGLQKRNRFAHPMSREVADAPIASGHVSELTRVMLELT